MRRSPKPTNLMACLRSTVPNFPATAEFSKLARESLKDISASDNADTVLMAWLEREELLFRRMERYIVSERLKTGLWQTMRPTLTAS